MIKTFSEPHLQGKVLNLIKGILQTPTANNTLNGNPKAENKVSMSVLTTSFQQCNEKKKN